MGGTMPNQRWRGSERMWRNDADLFGFDLSETITNKIPLPTLRQREPPESKARILSNMHQLSGEQQRPRHIIHPGETPISRDAIERDMRIICEMR